MAAVTDGERSAMQDEIVWGVKEVAEVLHVLPRTIYELARKGEIPCRKVGRRFLIPRDALLEWLAGDRTKEAASC